MRNEKVLVVLDEMPKNKTPMMKAVSVNSENVLAVSVMHNKGIARRDIDYSEICKRALLAMANEAALLLTEKVAGKMSDVDVVFASGYVFPRWEGGPVYWAKQ